MQPQVRSDVETNGHHSEPLRHDAEGHPVLPEWDESDPPPTPVPEPPSQELHDLEHASDSDLMAMAGIEPVVSTTEAAEYFDRTSQWIYWGLKPDDDGEHVFVWPDGSPIIPERIGDPLTGRRRFTMPILRAILQASYRRGNIETTELQTVIRRIRYTELGVEWREREGWKYVDLGRNRHRWVKPEDAYYDRSAKVWKLREEVTLEPSVEAPIPVIEAEIIDVEEVQL